MSRTIATPRTAAAGRPSGVVRLIRSVQAAAPLAALATVLWAGGAQAQVPGSDEEFAGGSATNPLSFRVSTGTTVGTSTFISDSYSGHADVVQGFGLMMNYQLRDLPLSPNLSVRQDLSWEFSQPENLSARRFNHGDTGIGLASSTLWNDTDLGLNIGGSLGVSLPISLASIGQRKITTTSASVYANKALGDFSLMLGVSASKHFYRYDTLVAEKEQKRFSDGTVSHYCRSDNDLCMGGQYAMNWSAGVNGSLTYTIMKDLYTTLGAGLGTGWRMAAPEDEFTSPNARDGTRVPDRTNLFLSLGYALTERLFLSVGGSTSQPLLSRDNKSLRNPIYDGAPRNNFSSLFVDINAAL